MPSAYAPGGVETPFADPAFLGRRPWRARKSGYGGLVVCLVGCCFLLLGIFGCRFCLAVFVFCFGVFAWDILVWLYVVVLWAGFGFGLLVFLVSSFLVPGFLIAFWFRLFRFPA
ncbi:hypothetical protein [Bifidobacterium adolescentis]|uniref:Transmembrane protein n=1 Tax=Bifidobacterium adolescentis TaxID=1680 RepID=A0A6I6QZY3_BIFAD|nr:hypothetical protein [Bifidobacterium adolescentis]QHB62731.1 hypothetical protein F3K97_05245 [Bifidobacterium adolescentis]